MYRRRSLGGLILDVTLTIIVVVLVLVFLLLLTTRHIPREYLETLNMPRETKARLANAFISDVWLLTEKQDNNDPFELSISDDEINAYLLGGLVSLREFVPPDIANPQIHFEKRAVVLMGTVKPRNFHPMVISIYCRPRVAYDGRLKLDVDKVRGGLLRIPLALVGNVLSGLDQISLVLPNVEIVPSPGRVLIYRDGK
ncbi:MAG: hypothetical protein V2A58_08315 [Planctomycetota bacterium]